MVGLRRGRKGGRGRKGEGGRRALLCLVLKSFLLYIIPPYKLVKVWLREVPQHPRRHTVTRESG
jgi:hypothetical protein